MLKKLNDDSLDQSAVTLHYQRPRFTRTNLSQAEGLERVISYWLRGMTENTQTAYRRDLDYFFAYIYNRYGSNCTLNQLTVDDLLEYEDELRLLDWKESTIQRRLCAVKSLFKHAHHLGLLPYNVASAIRLPAVEKTYSKKMVNKQTILQIINFPELESDRILLRFLYVTGCRVSEALELKWEDFRVDSAGDPIVHIFGKGRKDRWIKFSKETWQLLFSLRGDRLDTDYVFCSRTDPNKPIHYRVIHKLVAAAGRRYGINNFSPHWFRHSHAGECRRAGTSLEVIQESLGHESLDTTRRYLAANPDRSSALDIGL